VIDSGGGVNKITENVAEVSSLRLTSELVYVGNRMDEYGIPRDKVWAFESKMVTMLVYNYYVQNIELPTTSSKTTELV